jgi:uncharacterized protein
MSDRDEAPIGAPIWIDLMTSDIDGAIAFYAETLGWKAEAPDETFGGYVSFLNDGTPVAGCMAKNEGDAIPDRWTTYLRSDDARASVEAATARRSTVVVPVMDVGDLGTMAVVRDPGGAPIGVWEPKQHRGFMRTGSGAPGWFDLQTRDHAATVAFYVDIFHWTTNVLSDTDDFRYTTLKIGDTEYAGIHDASKFLPAHEQPQWTVVIAVDSTDETAAKVVQLGGGTVRPPGDSPYGRLATVSDPTGAVFGLISP